MLQKFEVSGVHLTVDDKLQKYVEKKIGSLDRYLPKHSRKSAHAKVLLKDAKAKDKKQCTCEVMLFLPRETINVKETTLNIYAAVDIVEAKLKQQIKKHKELRSDNKIRRRMLARFRRRPA